MMSRMHRSLVLVAVLLLSQSSSGFSPIGGETMMSTASLSLPCGKDGKTHVSVEFTPELTRGLSREVNMLLIRLKEIKRARAQGKLPEEQEPLVFEKGVNDGTTLFLECNPNRYVDDPFQAEMSVKVSNASGGMQISSTVKLTKVIQAVQQINGNRVVAMEPPVGTVVAPPRSSRGPRPYVVANKQPRGVVVQNNNSRKCSNRTSQPAAKRETVTHVFQAAKQLDGNHVVSTKLPKVLGQELKPTNGVKQQEPARRIQPINTGSETRDAMKTLSFWVPCMYERLAAAAS